MSGDGNEETPDSTAMTTMSFRRSAMIAAVFALAAATLPAQQIPTGRIVGRVIDATTGQGIADAGVQVVGSTKGVQSGVDGRFTLSSVDAGTITIQVRRVGYSAKTVTGLILNGRQTLEQNVTLA